LSIEFDVEGNCLDAEENICYKDLSPEVKATLDSELKVRFEKHKFSKIQLQTSGDLFLSHSFEKKAFPINEKWFYEIEFKAIKRQDNSSSEKKYFEVLTDQSGKILQTLEIIERPLYNLEF